MGEQQLKEGKGPSQNRVVLTTNNSYGNLVSQEGENPDAGTTYNAFPEKPVKIGDTWEGYRMVNNRKFSDSYVLNAIVMINGKDYAVVTCKGEENDGSTTTKSWIELSTGLQHKAETNGEFAHESGQRLKAWGTTHLVDASERPFLR